MENNFSRCMFCIFLLNIASHNYFETLTTKETQHIARAL